MNLYLTRHGQTEWNIEKRFQGWGDSPLTELGKNQALSLANRMKEVKIDVIYTSPIKRAYDTACLINGDRNIPIIKEDGLKEFFFGDWEGQRISDLEKDENNKLQIYNLFNEPSKFIPVNGESIEDVLKRSHKVIEKIIFECKDKDILVVTHGMTLKMIMLYFLGKDHELGRSGSVFGQASLTHIEVNDDMFKVVFSNDMRHYDENYIKKGW